MLNYSQEKKSRNLEKLRVSSFVVVAVNTSIYSFAVTIFRLLFPSYYFVINISKGSNAGLLLVYSFDVTFAQSLFHRISVAVFATILSICSFAIAIARLRFNDSISTRLQLRVLLNCYCFTVSYLKNI